MKLVIIGGVAGGASAAARARRLCEECEIIIFERGPHVSFANCGLPYFVGGEIVKQDDLLLQTPESLRARFNLDVRVRTEVIAIDRAGRFVRVRELDSGREYHQPYDALVLSTGAAALRPPIQGIDHDGHFVVRNIPDVELIMTWIKDCRACRAVVVGGGYIGLEMAAWLHHELRANGVELDLGDPVAAFEPPRSGETARASVLVLKSGKRLPADTVVLGLGVRPEISLANNAGLELGALGGIRVNEHLRTSDLHIWAVGDAIEVRDAVSGAWSIVPLAGPANRQGRIAADNIFGRANRYEGTWGTATGKLLGAQAVGREGVDKRIDVFATALKCGMTVHDLAELELAYAPPFGSAKDPVNLAGMAAQNVLNGDVQLAQWHEIATLNPATSALLDVRRADERTKGFVPGSIHIPLDELRSRTDDLPRDREIIVHCHIGQRSYFACRWLAQRGFRVRNLTGSWRTWSVATDS